MLGWLALTADGADPTCRYTLFAAFGAAAAIAYPPSQDPDLEVVVRRLGIFFHSQSATFDLFAEHGHELLDRLLVVSGPVAVVACSLGAAYGFYVRSHSVMWSFDSHGQSGAGEPGASAIRWDSARDMVLSVMISAVSEQGLAQFTVFRPL